MPILGKSANFVGKAWALVKAYPQPDGSVVAEGWISTPLQDMEKDILEPEAFKGDALANYFAKGAPVSFDHDTTSAPVGYMQKAVLVRNGVVIQQEDNPLHERANWLAYDGFGTGWYGNIRITEEKAADPVRKGLVRGFSWIGYPREWEPVDGGGRRFSRAGAINPLLETTITAYPINHTAIMRIAKARGWAPEDKKVVISKQALMDALTRSTAAQKTIHDTVDSIIWPRGTR